MRILEREIDFLAEDAWFEWHECPENTLESIQAISSQDMDYNDFCSWFEELSESKRIQLLVVYTIYEHNGWVYLVDNKKI